MRHEAITKRLIPEGERLEALPRHFGRLMMQVEGAIYDSMRMLAREYSGGLWTFNELSNGGFYMSPDIPGPLKIHCHMNGYEGEMSPDAAGITACLFALSHRSFRLYDSNSRGQE